jgi:hypothetical protein
VRESGRIVSVAVIIAVGVNSDGRREVLGLDIDGRGLVTPLSGTRSTIELWRIPR